MKRAFIVALMLVLVVALGATLVYAQGRWGCGQKGPGQCGMMGQGMGPGGGMMGGRGMGMGFGACAALAEPQTPAQKQFVEQVRGLHDRIRAEQAELINLRATNGNAGRISALETDLTGLRTRLHELLWNNRPLMQQMGVNCRMGPGACGPNLAKCADCPNKGTCPCYANGTCTMDPAKCADCPNKDKCPCYAKCQAGTCPANGGPCPAPCKQNCPAATSK